MPISASALRSASDNMPAASVLVLRATTGHDGGDRVAANGLMETRQCPDSDQAPGQCGVRPAPRWPVRGQASASSDPPPRTGQCGVRPVQSGTPSPHWASA
jgi:hypothetical protein